jgi:hypothetical protein
MDTLHQQHKILIEIMRMSSTRLKPTTLNRSLSTNPHKNLSTFVLQQMSTQASNELLVIDVERVRQLLLLATNRTTT